MKISIIAAIAKNRELGKNNKLLWRIPEDLKRFKALTLNHPVIMGRKTYESIGHTLPNRTNIIITRNIHYIAPNCKIFDSLEKSINFAKTIERDEIFIIGGGEIYKQALPHANKLYLTIVQSSFDADTFFPEYSEFKNVVYKKESKDKNYSYTFLELIKK